MASWALATLSSTTLPAMLSAFANARLAVPGVASPPVTPRIDEVRYPSRSAETVYARGARPVSRNVPRASVRADRSLRSRLPPKKAPPLDAPTRTPATGLRVVSSTTEPVIVAARARRSATAASAPRCTRMASLRAAKSSFQSASTARSPVSTPGSRYAPVASVSTATSSHTTSAPAAGFPVASTTVPWIVPPRLTVTL